MRNLTKFSFLCLLAVISLTQGRSAEDGKAENVSEEDGQRGILDFFFDRPGQDSNQQSFVDPPEYVPEAEPLAPSLHIPGNNPSSHHKPSLLNNWLGHEPLGGLLDKNKEKVPCAQLNQDWLRYAFQKCAKMDPRLLTAIVPTRSNKLREAKIYYFENSTANIMTWFDAQQWCTSRGMDLATVNDVTENRILQEKLKQIYGASAPAAVNNAGNPASFWIGLHDLNKDKRIKWIGDGSSTFVDWHTLTTPVEPAPVDGYCGAYSLVGNYDNVHMESRDCLTDNTIPKLRFICEVSSECAALFMSRYRHRHHQHHASSEEFGFINFN